MQERRRYVREHCSAIVELHHPGFGTLRLQARDLSESGIFVLTGAHTVPPAGAVVDVRIRRHSGHINADAVPMRVVRHAADGIALTFI